MCVGKTTRGLITIGFLALGPATGSADSIQVETKGVPVPLHRAGSKPSDPIQVDFKIEASAVEPIGDGKYVLIAHDKAAEFYVVEAATGKIIGPALTSDALPPTTEVGPKFEGMARDSRGNFYAIGSHAGKTDDERHQRAHLIRFRFQTDPKPGETPTIDPASVHRFDILASLKAALARESQDVAKLKIEGLAIREVPEASGHPASTQVFVGLREPSDLVRVFKAEISEGTTSGKPLAFEKLFAFEAGDREGVKATLTSLLYVPTWQGFFVLTATEDKDNVFHGNTLWFLSEKAIPAQGLAKVERVHDFEVAMKAEGLADLPRAIPSKTQLRLFVAFDNDAKSTHIPSRVQTINLSR